MSQDTNDIQFTDAADVNGKEIGSSEPSFPTATKAREEAKAAFKKHIYGAIAQAITAGMNKVEFNVDQIHEDSVSELKKELAGKGYEVDGGMRSQKGAYGTKYLSVKY